jgi:AraC-like DNA-binding protein
MPEMLHLSQEQIHQLITGRPIVKQEDLGYNLYHTTFESLIDDPICKGSTRSIFIREGMTFMQVELTFMQDTEVEMLSTQPQVGFCFFLKGLSTAYVKGLYGKKDGLFALHLSDRTSYIYANASSSGPQHFWANKTIEAMYIHFSYASFKELIGDALSKLPVELISTLSHTSDSYLHVTRMSQSVKSLCDSLLYNPFKGKGGEFYTEAKVIELIAHQVDALLKLDGSRAQPSPPLTKAEEKQITYCYQQLQMDLSQPPSLLELAKTTGLSVYRLKSGFQQMYGNTPVRLLTELRMLKAKELLEKGAHNVSEVAVEVGYASLGSFSNAFFERFGFRPSAYRK